MSGQSVPVVVVGAGPTGITAATLLAQHGVDCLVLDRWETVYPQPRAVHLDDEIYRIIGQLGVAQEFAQISRPTLGLQLRDANMRVLTTIHRDAAVGVHGYPQANMFDQPDFEALLRRNLERHPRAVLRGNSEVTDVTAVDSSCVRVTFADRVTGQVHTVDANYLLGCDGANSLVRSAIGGSMRDLKFRQRWLVVDIATDADLDQWEGVHQVCDPHRAATFMRIGATRYRWEFRLLPDESANDFESLTSLHPLIEPWVKDVALQELRVVRVAEYTFRAQLANCWRSGSIFLLGDAAHLTPPFIGQGMGAGLRDAMNLSWKLAGVVKRQLSPTVLDTYEQERKPHARSMIRLALAIGWAMTAGGRFGDFVRRVVTPRLDRVPGVRDRVVDSTTPPLRRGPLIRQPGRHRLAGRLCPNVVLPQRERFDAVVGTRFAVVASAPLSAAQNDDVRRRGAVVVTAEAGTELARWLHHGRASVAIVRPDRTVMRAGRDVAAVLRDLHDVMPSAAPTAAVNA